MEEQSLAHFQQRLLNEKKELEERIDGLDQGLKQSMADSIGELSLYDNHPADIGDELFERGKDLSLKDQGEIQLNNVKRALAKINNSTYGLCDKCGKSIGKERLEALPSANLCFSCKQEETGPDRTPRPIEEEVIRPPFGEHQDLSSQYKFKEGDDQTSFDGEDAWQAVARFGTSDSPQDIGEDNAQYPNVYVNSEEDVGAVDDVDKIPYYREQDGTNYQDFR